MKEKEMNLENQLRSWQPRRPSPRLKRRLFPFTGGNDGHGVWLRCLAPAAACLLLAITIMNQEPGLAASSARRQPTVGMLSSNLNYTYTPSANDRNQVAPPSFEWTNLSDSSSSISPFSPGLVN